MRKIFIIAFVALIGALIFQGCSYLPPTKEEVQTRIQDYTDSIIFEQMNPVFCTPEDAIIYREEIADKLREDSIFFSLPEKTLRDVASVIIKKSGCVTKRHVVEEYKAHRDIYTNLPATNPPANTNMEGSAKEKGRIVIGTDYNYKMDTIDGVPRHVQYKTEKSYEE